MNDLEFIKVDNEEFVGIIAGLADIIWREYFIPLIGKEQIDYMLKKFQSQIAITQQIKEGFQYFLIKEEGSDYIGYFNILPKDDYMFLSKLYIKSENRGKGCGRQSLRFIENLTRKNNLSKITLTVYKENYNSIKAYEKFGFVNLGSLVQDIGNGFIMDDYKMEKIISTN